MKSLSILILSIASIWFALTSSINPVSSKKNGKQSAAIYGLSINVSSELTTEGSIGAVSWSSSITEEQIERMRKFAESACSEKLDADVRCVYKYNKKGKKLATLGNGNIAGMPTNSFKNAVESNDDDLFISIQMHMTNDGKPLKVGKKKSTIQPKASGFIRIFDREKTLIKKGKWSQSLLEGIVSLEDKDDVLTPNDIETIYKYMIENMIKDM
ncbi:MAG: hypothetical protein MK105_04405 [Crocinitomicaceae bacterium]|nr:hypothetical protein [Crocinitomicaceae bacterium]